MLQQPDAPRALGDAYGVLAELVDKEKLGIYLQRLQQACRPGVPPRQISRSIFRKIIGFSSKSITFLKIEMLQQPDAPRALGDALQAVLAELVDKKLGIYLQRLQQACRPGVPAGARSAARC